MSSTYKLYNFLQSIYAETNATMHILPPESIKHFPIYIPPCTVPGETYAGSYQKTKKR